MSLEPKARITALPRPTGAVSIDLSRRLACSIVRTSDPPQGRINETTRPIGKVVTDGDC